MAVYDARVRAALNNLGGGFPPRNDFQLGDVFNVWGVPDPTTLNQLTPKTIYVETPANGGSDDTGDGASVATAFATPQTAWDTVARLAEGGFFLIQCGEGTFPTPILDKPLQSGTYCFFIGARDDNNAETIVFGSPPSFAAVSGSGVRLRANIGAYGFTINNETHWVELNYGSPFPPWGTPCLPSASPNLDVPRVRFGNTGGVAVRPFLTTFEPVQGDAFSGGGTGYNSGFVNLAALDLVGFVGIQFDGLVNQSFDNLGFFGCHIATGANLHNCFFDSSASGNFLQGYGLSIVGGALTTGLNFDAVGVLGNRVDYLYIDSAGIFSRAYVSLDNIDFVDAGARCVQVEDARVNWSPNADVTVSGTVTDFARLLGHAAILFNTGVTVTGAVSANGIEIERNSWVTGAEAACSGTLTAGGSEIVVGGNAGATFASLPANDSGAASPQFCSAT